MNQFILDKVNRGKQTIIDRIYDGTDKSFVLDLFKDFNDPEKGFVDVIGGEKKLDPNALDLEGDIEEQISLGDSFMDTKVILGDRSETKKFVEGRAFS